MFRPGRLRYFIVLALAVLSLGWLSAPAAQADVNWSDPQGPGHYLVVAIPSGCLDANYNWTTTCNAELLMRMYGADVLNDDRLPRVAMKLTNSAGAAIPLEFDTVPPFDGLNEVDPTYSEGFAEAQPTIALPPDSYTFTATYSTAGVWSCSIYDPNGCSWIAPDGYSMTYKFTWDGHTRVQVSPLVPPAPAPTATTSATSGSKACKAAQTKVRSLKAKQKKAKKHHQTALAKRLTKKLHTAQSKQRKACR